ncbi:F-box protein At5g07610-like [Aegilops tauschii subsp. strangulata]|uniref:F-box protein At5g07610-like n=1 Tax=Aegilops tauschii subsp. strangulata TaxID=200361 RepID=UPI00098ACA84|nr:uncharacterized protein LOC109762081 [Aegilops tauschii subsp. strangulata]
MPLDNDDLLREILLLLPPEPSSLLRASVVCKRWRRFVSDRGFLRRFRAHHGKPPVLGFFCVNAGTGYYFSPTLDPPDRIPAARFSLPQRHRESLDFVECRHGLVLFLDKKLSEAVVWNPISGRQRRVAIPPEFGNPEKWGIIYAVVLCAAGDDDHGHGHGDCDLDYFKLVVVRMGVKDYRHVSACLYESKSGVWGNVVSTTTTGAFIFPAKPSVLVGNALCWLLNRKTEGDILEFDFEVQKLVVTERPLDCEIANRGLPFLRIMRTEQNNLGLIGYTGRSLRLWERKVNYDGVATWFLQKTIDLVKHLSPVELRWSSINGYDEDHNVLFLWIFNGSLMIQLDSIQFGNCSRTNLDATTPPVRKEIYTTYVPYTSFSAAGNSRFLQIQLSCGVWLL